ncbi:MAG: hypothetical protein Q9186_006643, partial [Xanthomendoza sp. 1 TL-2023]
MATLSARQVFQPSCPQGGSWTACGFGSRFVGCCLNASAACINGCSDSDLKPANFVGHHYLEITNSDCPSDSQWYTCAFTTPTFMGCCASNPCSQNGCTLKDLRAASLSKDQARAGPYSAILDPSSMAAIQSAITASAPASSTTGPNTDIDTTAAAFSPRHTSVAVVIAGVVCGLAAIALVAAFTFWSVRRRSQHRTSGPIPLQDRNPFVLQGGKQIPTRDHQTLPRDAPVTVDFSTAGFHELDTPSSSSGNITEGKAYEMPSPDVGVVKVMV